MHQHSSSAHCSCRVPTVQMERARRAGKPLIISRLPTLGDRPAGGYIQVRAGRQAGWLGAGWLACRCIAARAAAGAEQVALTPPPPSACNREMRRCWWHWLQRCCCQACEWACLRIWQPSQQLQPPWQPHLPLRPRWLLAAAAARARAPLATASARWGGPQCGQTTCFLRS